MCGRKAGAAVAGASYTVGYYNVLFSNVRCIEIMISEEIWHFVGNS